VRVGPVLMTAAAELLTQLNIALLPNQITQITNPLSGLTVGQSILLCVYMCMPTQGALCLPVIINFDFTILYPTLTVSQLTRSLGNTLSDYINATYYNGSQTSIKAK
jgi:hypothetical protein